MYKISKIKDGTFELLEIATEQRVAIFKTHKTAKKWYNAFKGGRAFNGWTPSFFLVGGLNLDDFGEI